jgi:hypothetical protein
MDLEGVAHLLSCSYQPSVRYNLILRTYRTNSKPDAMRTVYISPNCLSRKKRFYWMKILDATEKSRYQ